MEFRKMNASAQYKVTEGYVLRALSHAVKGSWRDVAQVGHPLLREAGIDFTTAVVRPVGTHLFRLISAPTLRRSDTTLKQMTSQPGDWFLSLRAKGTPSMDTLDVAVFSKDVPSVLRLVGDGRIQSPILLRPDRGGIFLATTGRALKDLISNSPS